MANSKKDREPVDGAKWRDGFGDVTRWFKDLGISLRGNFFTLLIVLAVVGACWFSGKLVDRLLPKKAQPAIGTVSGGAVKVDTSTNKDEEHNNGLVIKLPFSR